MPDERERETTAGLIDLTGISLTELLTQVDATGDDTVLTRSLRRVTAPNDDAVSAFNSAL